VVDAELRLAYLILAHQLPEQLIRLVRRLDGPDTTFLVHIDRRADDAILAAAGAELAQPNVTFLPRIPCHWGTWSIVEATLSGIRQALRADAPFDYLLLMTGQDYPIKPRAEIETTLGQAEGRSFVHHVPLPKPDWPNSLGRVERWHYPPGLRNRLLERVRNRWSVPRRVPSGLALHGGAQLWSMSREAAQYVDDFTARNPEVVRFFHHVHVPDEMYFQTVLASSPLRGKLICDGLHFLEWLRPGHTLGEEDLDALAATYYLFARKFDLRVDGKVLDLIDQRLLAG
jgi:hypothetical protein